MNDLFDALGLELQRQRFTELVGLSQPREAPSSTAPNRAWGSLADVETGHGTPRLPGLHIHAIKPQLTLAPVVPALSEFIELYTASVVESHAGARRLAHALAA